MNGPGQGPGYPPHRPAATRSGPVLFRVLFVAVTVCSVGILCWVPLLRLAIVRRRTADWALFWSVLVLTLAALWFLRESNADHISSDIAMAVLLAMGAGAIGYYLRADIRHHRAVAAAAAGSAPSTVPGPYGPFAGPGAAPVPAPGPAAHGYGYPPPHPYPHVPGPSPAPHAPAGPGHGPAPAAPAGYHPAPDPSPGGHRPPAPVQPHHTPQPHHAPQVSQPSHAPQTPQPHHTPQPSQRIGQVRAELDELSDLLRREQNR
ncbi:hypothetical protein [Streptomyces sp. NPDC018031]|uniref:hypothetical protein n=1 Tax=Streptomyces sp. NPDC018031 TaxID=3365033 RepID=UPI003794277B